MGYNIVHLEMVNVVVALKVWGQQWANKCVRLYCDNQAVVEVLSSGKARDQILAMCTRNVWLLTATYNIDLLVSHIQGTKNNVANLLSRWRNTTEDVQKLYHLIESPVWVNTDIALTYLNHDI